MTDAPRTVAQALAFARAEHEHASRDWTNYCQKFVRSCYGIPSLFASAWAQWLGADDEDKHVGGHPNEAPVGAALCYKGSSPYGHIMLAANETPNGSPGAWSNDLVRRGGIDMVLRTAPTSQWGQGYLGYLTAVNGYDLNIKTAEPPAPKEDTPYVRISRAIDRLEKARETARELGEHDDARALTDEIEDLRGLYNHLRHA